jgi:hypothetical protein
MKRLIIAALITILTISTAYAGTVLIKGATTTGTGKQINVDGQTVHTYSCAFLTSTSITAFTSVLQGSIDNKATWHDLSTHAYDATEISNKYGMRHVYSKPVDWARINITVATGPDLDADCYHRQGGNR